MASKAEPLRTGQRVQYIGGGSWKPTGTVTKVYPKITINDAQLQSPMVDVELDIEFGGQVLEQFFMDEFVRV